MVPSQLSNSLFRIHWFRVLALVFLLALIGVSTLTFKVSVLDLDLGWHLKTGDWILQHRAVPHTGLFTWTAADHRWAAYSWGYEVLLSLWYHAFGLVGMALYGTLLTLGVSFAIYWMARRLSGNFWTAFLVTALSCAAFLLSLNPRPVFFSMILLCVTLALLLEANRTGEQRHLYWLPLIFFAWANLHIQFIYGLFLVGLLLAVTLAQRLAARLGWNLAWLRPPALPSLTLAWVGAACIAATCISPYSYHLYGIVLRYAQSKTAYHVIMELQPVNFSVGSNYVMLLWMAFAFFAVGRRPQVDAFKLILLSVASVVAFRTMRDSWFICIIAAACIADAMWGVTVAEPGENPLELLSAGALLSAVLLVAAWQTDFSRPRLEEEMTQVLPVGAVNYLRQHPEPGLLYNPMDWGGFLTWYMPERPVAIDGRTDLYGDQMEELFFRTSGGAPSYLDDPYLNESSVVLLEKQNRLRFVLQKNPRYQLVYQDGVSSLFIRRQ